MNKTIRFLLGAFALIVGCLASFGPSLLPRGHSGPAPTNSATLQEYRVHRLSALVRPFALLLFLAATVAITLHGYEVAGVGGMLLAFVIMQYAGAPLVYRANAGVAYAPTLTTPQLLLDVMQSFRKWFPGLGNIGTDFRGTPLKLNETYTAHIAALPISSTYDENAGGYENGANEARNLLADVPVLVDNQPTCPLVWHHIDQIQDVKNKYDEVISGAGYIIAKGAVDTGIFAKSTTRYFSQEIVSAVLDCDWDWLQTLVGTMNGKGCMPFGRILFVNTAVANVLASDPRLISKQFAGQQLDGNAYRQWINIGGFALIQEYPDLPSNNGVALAAITAVAATDVLTQAAHGLVTGDPLVFSVLGAGGAGLVINTRYFVIKIDANTFKLATTRAKALAATAIDITTDLAASTGALTENLIALAVDKRAVGFLAGIPDGMQSDICEQLGIPRTMVFETVLDKTSGQTMAMAKWQKNGTGKVYVCPTFVFGTHVGRQGATAVKGNTLAQNSALASANADGSACDYAGLRVSSGAT